MPNIFMYGGAAIMLAALVAGWAKSIEIRGVEKGVEKERASVTKEADNKHARSKTARAAVTDDNAIRMLSPYFRD